MPDNFDKMAVVVDWLDACRNRDLDALLDMYAGDAGLECACEAFEIRGRAALAAYWKPRLAGFVPSAFGLEEIKPHPDGVVLDCRNFQGRPVRIFFTFDDQGKVTLTSCQPAAS